MLSPSTHVGPRGLADHVTALTGGHVPTLTVRRLWGLPFPLEIFRTFPIILTVHPQTGDGTVAVDIRMPARVGRGAGLRGTAARGTGVPPQHAADAHARATSGHARATRGGAPGPGQ